MHCTYSTDIWNCPPSTPRHFPWKRPVKLVDLPCQFLDLPCQFSARCHDVLASWWLNGGIKAWSTEACFGDSDLATLWSFAWCLDVKQLFSFPPVGTLQKCLLWFWQSFRYLNLTFAAQLSRQRFSFFRDLNGFNGWLPKLKQLVADGWTVLQLFCELCHGFRAVLFLYRMRQRPLLVSSQESCRYQVNRVQVYQVLSFRSPQVAMVALTAWRGWIDLHRDQMGHWNFNHRNWRMECVEFLLGKQHPFVLGTPYLVVYTRWDCKWMDESIFWDFFGKSTRNWDLLWQNWDLLPLLAQIQVTRKNSLLHCGQLYVCL